MLKDNKWGDGPLFLYEVFLDRFEKKLCNGYGFDGVLLMKDVKFVLCRCGFNRNVRMRILGEMQRLGMIKILNHQKIKILKADIYLKK